MTTITASVNGARSVDAIRLAAHEAAARNWGRRLSRGQTAAVVMSIALGVVVASYRLASSYLSIADLADRHHAPLPEQVLAGIDGDLVAVVVLDLVLTSHLHAGGVASATGPGMSVGTVASNAVAGWPDPVDVGLHAAAPLILLAMIEAGRCPVILRPTVTR